jgi:hypothetical protein
VTWKAVAHRLLMCRPQYFDVSYSIDPWMHPEKPTDAATALAGAGLRLSHSRTPASAPCFGPAEHTPGRTPPGRRYLQMTAGRRAYPSDLSDARWELIEPVLSA